MVTEKDASAKDRFLLSCVLNSIFVTLPVIKVLEDSNASALSVTENKVPLYPGIASPSIDVAIKR